MSLHDYLELFRHAIEKAEYYGYAESIEINEHKHIKGGVIIESILPDVSDIMDEVLGFL